MKCAECGERMEAIEGVHRYDECGLDNIHLMDIPMYKCPSCGETEVEIPCMEELHQLLGLLVVFKPKRLSQNEVKYLRNHLGYTQEELATQMGVTRPSVARWETEKPITLNNDLSLRRLYLEQKGQEFDSFSEVKEILEAILVEVAASSKKVRIRKRVWTNRLDQALCNA